MKKTLTKLLMTILAISMVFGMCGIVAIAADNTATFKIVGEDISETAQVEGAIELSLYGKFSANVTATTLSLLLEYDNNAVVPLDPGFGDDLSGTDIAYAISPGLTGFGVLPVKTIVIEDRTALYIPMNATTGARLRANTETLLMKVAFRVKDETLMNSETIKVLKDDYFVSGSAYSQVSIDPTTISAISVNITEYAYGRPQSESYPENVDNATLESISYPGSDKPATPAGPTETTWTVADSNASATVVYNSPVSGTPMIAVYDATGKMIGFKAETTAVENQSSFTISTTYNGTAAKAKVFVWAADKTTTVGAKVWTPAN